jgi:hypothetical protein
MTRAPDPVPDAEIPEPPTDETKEPLTENPEVPDQDSTVTQPEIVNESV